MTQSPRRRVFLTQVAGHPNRLRDRPVVLPLVPLLVVGAMMLCTGAGMA